MSSNVRDYLKTEITPLLPATWSIIPNQKIPETISKITVVLKHLRILPLAEASIGSLRHHVTVTVADPHGDQVLAENALDNAVLELLTALDGHSKIVWTDATKVLVNDTYLGWDISLEVITQKE